MDKNIHVNFIGIFKYGGLFYMKFKYDEIKNIEKVKQYIESTYNQHYVGEDGTQIQDLLNSIGIASKFCQGNAMKYIARYGRKNGRNEMDLMKAIHYILLMIHFNKSERNNNKEKYNENK